MNVCARRTRDRQHRLMKLRRDGWSGEYGVDAALENREHRLIKPGGWIISTESKGTEYEWRRLRRKDGYSGFLSRIFVFILVSLSFVVALLFVIPLSVLVPFMLLVSFAGWGLLSEMTVRTRRRMAEEEYCMFCTRWLGRSCGGKTAPTTKKPRI